MRKSNNLNVETGEGRHSVSLGHLATNWPTPTTQEISHKDMEVNEKGRRMTKDKKDSHSLNLQDTTANWNLPEEEKSWPTPMQRDYKGMDGPGKTNPLKPPELYLSIPPDPKKQIDGHTCSVSCRRLNPHFAEWLMGLCLGWTSVSEPLETESFQAWQQSLSELLQKISD
jgi:hypothetical protein